MRRYRETGRKKGSQTIPWRLALCLVVGGCLMTNEAMQAAPITLRFNATIQSLSTGIPFDSGIDFAVGDVVSGQFTFEPQLGDGNAVFESSHPYQFEFNINGSHFASPNYETEAVNNSLITDFPLVNRIDSIRLGADNLQAKNPAEFPNIDPLPSGFQMTLYGSDDVFAQASLPADVNTWNEFTLWRMVRVSFRDGNGNVVGFNAQLSPFVQVPEPSAIAIALVGLSAVICEVTVCRRRRS